MGDWGKRIRLVFADDGGGAELYDIKSAELIAKFRLKEDNYDSYIYPSYVTIGDAPNVLNLNFADINQAQMPLTLEYLGGASLRGKDLPVDSFAIIPNISWWNFNRHGDYEHIELLSVDVSGEIALAFDGKGYTAEHLELNTIGVVGENVLIKISDGESNEYLKLDTVSVIGVYADANGVPV